MSRVAGRPAGVAVIAAVVALNGVASLLESVELAGTGDRVVATLPAVLGLLLMHRAYALWQIHPGAWLVTTLVLVLKAVTSALEIVGGAAVPGTWLTLGISVGCVLYLLLPGTRSLFSATRAR